MPRTRLFRARADRVIGWARLILAAASIAALSLDPGLSERRSYVASVIFGCYVALAAVSLPFGRWLAHPRWFGLTLHLADLAVFTAVLCLTDGPTSPYFVLFNFSVLAAALQWRWKGALWTSVGVLGLFLVTALIFSLWLPADFEATPFLVRCAQLLAVGLLLVYFGLHQERFFEELARLTTWPEMPAGRRREQLPIRSVLAHVAKVFDAPRILLIWTDPEEPWIYATEWRDGEYREERLPPDVWDQVLAHPIRDRACLFGSSGKTTFLDEAGRVLPAPSPAVDLSLQRFDIASGLSIPVRGESIEGQLFVLDKRDLSLEDLSVAAVVAARVDAAVEHAAALEMWRRTAAAEDRLRVARDLHDGILQVLAGTNLRLQSLCIMAGKEVADRIGSLQRWLVYEQRELRGFIRRLEPGAEPDRDKSVDLAADLNRLAKRLQEQGTIAVTVSVEPPDARVPATVGFDLYQLLRESAANAVRHGKASALSICVLVGNELLRLEIADDGCGFPFEGAL
jgi:signal transduction histidine kinase